MTRARLHLVPALVLGMSACAPLVSDPAPSAPAKPAVSAAPAPMRERAAAPVRPAKPARAVRPAEPPLPPKLVGLTEAEAAELLGSPAEEAAQPPGKVWVYRAEGCVLSVHFFPDVQKGGFHALDVTAEGGGRDACLAKVAGAARKE